MKKYEVFVKLNPRIVTLTMQDLIRESEEAEVSAIINSDLSEEEKEIAKLDLFNRHISDYNRINTSLKLIRKEYSPMEHFYVRRGKNTFIASENHVVLADSDFENDRLTELPYFIYFAENVSRYAIVNGTAVQVLYRMENQYIVSRNGNYSIAVEDNEFAIKYGKKLEYTPKPDEICETITGLVKRYRPSKRRCILNRK